MSGFQVIVWGAGTVVRELMLALQRLDFEVVRRAASPIGARSSRAPRLTPRTFVVAATRDLEADLDIIRRVLASPAGFLAVLGSRSRGAALRRRLRAEGLRPGDLRRLHCPAGLPIRSITPAEIGLSIAAQLVQERAKVLFGPAAGGGASR